MNIKSSLAIAPGNQRIPRFKNNTDAALFWHRFGFDVIPIVPLLKRPALKWDSWLDSLNAEKIAAHWAKYPNHEVGFIVGDSLLVLDADSPESVAALHTIEKESGMPPLMVVITRRGEHHYFRRSDKTFAKSDAHSTEQHPDRIDVKTGRSIVVLPPSTGKVIKACWVESADKLFEVEQDFIDMVFQHNGREVPRPLVAAAGANEVREIDSNAQTKLIALLKHLDPEEGGHDGWVRIGMAIHTETDGDDEGLEIFDQWSRKGSTYPGRPMIEAKWRSFASNRADRCNIGTIINRVTAAGLDWMAICSEAEDHFEPFESEVIEYRQAAMLEPAASLVVVNPLDKYSLRGMSDEITRLAGTQEPILGGLANKGQATAMFAPPNSGKTLITLAECCEDVRVGRIDPAMLYYVNVDDSAKGLAEKLALADEYGFHILAEGYNTFKASDLLGVLNSMIESDCARNVVIILDTVKKFTNVMDKTASSHFTRVIRSFVLKGGTVIALAHTNKRSGPDGKPIYGGTSDIVDDFDCAYTVAPGVSPNKDEKVVVFENIKRRGDNPSHRAYRYSIESGLSYAELLSSVAIAEDSEVSTTRQNPELSNTRLIEAIQHCIAQGINTKMNLAAEAAKLSGSSKRSALSVIERYTGDDPAVHKWTFAVRERGAKVFTLLDNSAPPTAPAD